jgi:hypothetical protein
MPYCHKLVPLALLSPHVLLSQYTLYTKTHNLLLMSPIYTNVYQMVKLPTLSNKVVQTSSETTSEVHVRSAVEDAGWLHCSHIHSSVHTDKAHYDTHLSGMFVANELERQALSQPGRK